MTNLEKENKDSYSIYFIENHITTSSPIISLTGDTGGLFGELKKCISELCPNTKTNETFVYTLYSFKIFPSKIMERKKNKIEIKLELNSEEGVFIFKMDITEFDKDNYIYDLQFQDKSPLKKAKPPKSLKLTRKEQFEIFKNNLLKEGVKNQKDKRREDLIVSSQKLLQEKFAFNFYIILFLECISPLIRIKHFSYFDPKKIEEKGDIEEYKKKTVNFLNAFRKNPENTLKEIKEENEKEQIGTKLFAFLLSFYHEYIKEEFEIAMESKNEIAIKYINNALLIYSYFFFDEKLSKDKVQELINISKTYDDLSKSIQYVKILSDLLDLVNSNFDKFKELYLIEKKKKKNPKINLESIILVREEEDIKAICEKYEELVKKQKNEMKCESPSIFMSGSLFDKYISYYEGTNLEGLLQIKETIKKLGVEGEMNKDIDKSIYETGSILSKNGKMNNIKILELIQKLTEDKKKKESIKNAIELISGLKIDEFDLKCYDKWKEINWNEKLYNKDNLNSLLNDKVIGLIKDFQNFDCLFKLLNISSKPDKIEISFSSIEMMRNKFIELYRNYDYNKMKDTDLKKVIIPLITYSKNEKKEVGSVKTFLKNLNEILNEALINDIFISLLSEYGDSLNKEIINFILEFYILDRELNHEDLLKLIELCSDNIIDTILTGLSRFNIRENDFLMIEENERYKLFKGLLNKGIIKNNRFKIIYYNERANAITKELQKILKEGEGKIDWTQIYSFYSESENQEEKEKKEKAFKDKLLSIFLNDEEQASNIKSRYDEYNNTTKKKLESLSVILEDFLGFFKEDQKDNIQSLKEHIKNMSSGPINYYEKNKQAIDDLINRYEDEAIQRNEKSKSIFFTYIYKLKKNQYIKDNEQKWLDETEKDFEQLKNIFNDKGINFFSRNNKQLFNLCLKAIKGKNKDDILKEINLLIKLFEENVSEEIKGKIVDDLLLLTKKEDILNVSSAILSFIKNANLRGGELKKIVEDIDNNKNNLNDYKILKKYMNSLKEYNIDIDILNNKNYKYDNYLNILLYLNEMPESIKFLLKTKLDDVRKIQEVASSNDDELINLNSIKDFKECVKFKNKFGSEGKEASDIDFKKKKDDEFFKLFEEEVKKTPKIEIIFKKYISAYKALSDLFKKKFDKSAASKYKILAICQNSNFILKNIKKEFFKGFYQQDNKNEKIKLTTLKELRDRAQLTKKVSNDQKEKETYEKFKDFTEKVSTICKIYDLIKEIYSSGYVEEIIITVDIKDSNETYKGCGLTTSQSSELIKKLKEQILEFKKKQNSAYRERVLMRYIYGRQINLIYDKLYNNKNIDILPLLKFITNNSQIKKDNIDFKVSKQKDIYNNIDRYLKSILDENDITMKKINEKYNIKEKDGESEFTGIYTFQADNVQKNVLQLYKYLTNSNPKAQYILLCNKETTNEELTAFLYRAILCDYHSCFIISGVELLAFEQKEILNHLLTDLYEKNIKENKKMKSCLIVAYTDIESDIIKRVFSLRGRKALRNKMQNLENQNMENVGDNVQIIKSDKSGVGKSTYIKQEIEKSKRDYIYFPLGGVFTRKDVLKRLKDLKRINNGTLHIDLNDTDQIDLMMEFLFSILITKIYGQNEDIFYLPKEVPIMVEIPNGFVDFKKKFPLLDIFEKKIINLEIENLKPLIVEKKIDTYIQIVANYLKLLKKNDNSIDTNDLYFEGISPPDWKKKSKIIIVKALESEECQNLIFERIKERIQYPNYYQITSFINLLGTQLRKFSQSIVLSVNYWLENLPGKNIGNIRSFVINNFINFTKYFTENGFIDLINTQVKTLRQIRRKFDEDKDNEEAIQKLSEIDNNEDENNLINFEKLDPSLLIFEEKEGESFNIISNRKNKKECDIYLQLLRSQIRNAVIPRLNELPEEAKNKEMNVKNKNKGEREKQEEKKKQEKQKLFLEQLKNILGIHNEVGEPIEKEKIEKENGKKKNTKKIIFKIENDDGEEEEVEEDISEDEEDNNEENNNRKTLFEIADNYVFTADNYFKMALILLRIRAGIPVIMMGETGCGKTSLIRKLSELLNNGAKNKMKTLNIHAGTSDKDIINFLEKKVIPKAKKLQENEEKQKKARTKLGQLFYETKFWVFLDEINTCKSMGLISEIMCKHTYEGKDIPTNVAFIAACNPYRYDSKKIKNKAGLNIKDAKKEIQKNLQDIKEREKLEKSSTVNSLIYTVNPLPHSLLNFVFNFGNLNPKDEEEYIHNIIEQSQKKIFNKYKEKENLNENNFIEIHKLAKDLIITAQNYIRDKNDKSSVSLREIRRFSIFFEFFFKYLSEKKNGEFNDSKNNILSQEDIKFYSNLKFKDIQIYSIILSVFVCYYLRIPENHIRKDLNDILSEKLQNFYGQYENFNELPIKEEKFIAENIELEKGIAKNSALLDNIFSLFVTINTKVPIFIVGKPGCSKSLSVQLINKAMKGSSTTNPLFNKFPRIIMNCFQGSMGSTSKGVKSVFKKARDTLMNIQNQKDVNEIKDENKKEDKIISMIYFDEMGLAEHSPNNPLKVIHSELEYDLNEGDKKVAFVGISNWALDASKMNRGLYLSIPDPEEKDVQLTSYIIGESYDADLATNYKKLYENVGEIYYNYKQHIMSQFNNGFEEFHGNRDFYHLVKNVGNNIFLKNIKNLDPNTKNAFVLQGIERNFAGLLLNNPEETSLKRIKKYYRDHDRNIQIEDKYDVIQRITENIDDIKSRYLLVISKPSISEFLLSSILNKKKKEYNYYKGSPFKDDLKSEEYILKILNKVQLHMEQDKVLILNNLGTVYPALYDLFNQNFSQVSNKNYARIALGYTTNAYSLVDDNFRCIVNVDEDKISKEEPPFLNRFEKHIISFADLINDNEKKLSEEIYNLLTQLTEYNEQFKSFEGINFSLKDIFINLDKEEINGYIYKLNKSGVKFDDLKYKILEKLSLILPQDIILFMKYSGFETRNKEIAEKIINGYEQGQHVNINKFLKKMKNMKNIIYTLGEILENDKIEDFENDKLGKIKIDNISEIKISKYTSENKFEESINDFFIDKNKKLCFIKFNFNERHFLNYVKFVIENKEKEFIENNDEKEISKKAFVFIVYLNRNFIDNNASQSTRDEENDNNLGSKYDETISLTSEFYQIFIDDLYGDDNCTLKDILYLKGKELFKKAVGNDRLDKDILQSLLFMDYSIPYEFNEIKKQNYVNKITDLIRSDNDMKNKINNIIFEEMGKDEQILLKAFNKKNLVSTYDIDILSSIRRYLSEIYSHTLNNFYYRAEKDQFFSTLLSLEKPKENNQNINRNRNVIKNEDNDDNENDMNIIKNNQENEKDINNGENLHKINVINEAKQLYLEEFKFEKETEDKNDRKEEDKKNNQNINIIEQLGANKINIILGLQLPGMFKIIFDIIKRTRNEVLKKYNINESSLRKYIEDEEAENAKAEYEKTLKSLDENIKIDLIKNNKINGLIKLGDNEKNELYEAILEDYYTIFINNNLSKYIISLYQKKKNYSFNLLELKNILKFVINQNESIKKDNLDFDTVARIINWVEFYSLEITYILKIYLTFKDNIENIYQNIKNIVEHIEYENSERCKEYTSKVNKALFFGFESLLKIITTDKKLYLNFCEQNQISKLIDKTEEVLNQINKFNVNLKLYSKELLSLQEIIVIINELNSKKICNSDNLKKILKYFSESIKDKDKLLDNFVIFFKDLEETLGKKKDKNYYKIISTVLKNEFMKHFYNDEFKNKIIEIIITNKDYEYIASNYQLLRIILEFDITPSKIEESFEKIKDDKNLLQIIDNNCQNEFLEQYILNIYDYQFMLYFTKTPGNIETSIKNHNNEEDINKFIKLTNDLKRKIEKKEKKVDNTGIIFDLSLKIFKECVNYLNNINNPKEENKNLAKLYSISYIKSYLSQLVNFSLNSHQQLGSIKDIIDIIESKKGGLLKVIKLYIIKLFFYTEKVKKKFSELSKINFKDLNYNFIIQMIDEENEEKEVFKEIIEEKESPNLEKYKEYTYLKYFTYSRNKESELKLFKKQVIKQEDYENKYPCIYLYLCESESESKDKKLKVMKYIEKYNEFCNLMVDNYSFIITREEAKEQKLSEQKLYEKLTKTIDGKKKKNNIFEQFFIIWDEIKDKAVEYQSNKLEIKELDKDNSLAYFLNDANEADYGMYIAAGYQYFIKLQNDFLNYIIEHGNDKPYLKLYFENMENKIPIYEANNNQILLLYQIYKTSEYKSLGEIVNTFTKRKIYNKDGTINYKNYNEFEFDYQSIEEELSKLILPGKCLFENETNLNFVTYWGEGFNGGKSDFLQRFEKSYETETLTDEEKSKIFTYVKENYNDQNDYKQIYGYIQLLVFYLINNNCNEEDNINNIIVSSKDYLKIDDQNFQGIFNANGIELKAKKLIDIFLFIEHLCFEEFSKNIEEDYKKNIDNMAKNQIIDNKNKFMNVKELAAALRRFISRLLYRIKNKNDLSPEGKLDIQLKRLDLWDQKFRKIETIEKIVNQINEFDLTVGQSFELYQLIKSEDENEIANYAEKEEDERPKIQIVQKQKKRFKN